MKRNPANPWVGIGMDAWMLGLEASSVIVMRSLIMAAGGPDSAAEARLMVTEKIASSLALGLKAASGGLGHSPASVTAKTVSHFRRKVRANRRRLQKSA